MLHFSRFVLASLVGAICLTGCGINSSKMFSWAKPKNAQTMEWPDDQLAKPQKNEPGSDAGGAGTIAQASASRTLTPIQKELNAFQSFPFNVELSDVSGRPIRLQDHLGKVVIVDLWGTWCGPCRRVIPHLVKLQKKHPQQLQVIGLCNERTQDVGAATASLTAAMNEFGINYPCALIDDRTVRTVPNFSGYPTMLFIDRAGKVRMVTVGVKPEAYWDSLLEELLAS
ncbi:MAG: TlpA disulfide reductase family protein [Pirellulaceae bacterium]|nr:TlpA disulfide reductase family protein [Pirellulaceae bacterium]